VSLEKVNGIHQGAVLHFLGGFEAGLIPVRAAGRLHPSFTAPVDAKTAADPASYSMDAWTYILQGSYGSPEVDQATPVIKSAKVSDDGKSVRLTIEGLVRGHVHHLLAPGVKSATGQALWHPEAFYTLNEIPAG
jgi:hypothetical protein